MNQGIPPSERKSGEAAGSIGMNFREELMMRFCTAVNCMDGRVQLPVIRYLQDRFDVEHVDCVTEPGPNLILAKRTEEDVVQSILRRIGISVEKHSSVAIALAGHHDCAGNPAAQQEQKQDLIAGIEFLRCQYPNIPIIGLWVDEKWEVHEVFDSEQKAVPDGDTAR